MYGVLAYDVIGCRACGMEMWLRRLWGIEVDSNIEQIVNRLVTDLMNSQKTLF